jgi:hypothetical protein
MAGMEAHPREVLGDHVDGAQTGTGQIVDPNAIALPYIDFGGKLTIAKEPENEEKE